MQENTTQSKREVKVNSKQMKFTKKKLLIRIMMIMMMTMTMTMTMMMIIMIMTRYQSSELRAQIQSSEYRAQSLEYSLRM